MKRREFLKLSATLTGAAMAIYLPAGWTTAKAAAKWKVGFSQATTLEPWRVQFNKDIEAEAKNHPEIQLIITDGQDKTEKQVADVENLINQQVDVLLISPKESAGLTGVVEKAIDAKIPVIVLDRNVDTKRITQFIGGDNKLIGKTAGEYAVKLLGGPGKAQGSVVEI
jgi:ribose transport system substrate-binding protein